MSRDAGSIPAASTSSHFALKCEVAFLMQARAHSGGRSAVYGAAAMNASMWSASLPAMRWARVRYFLAWSCWPSMWK
jgi:hypothetical protein